MRPSFAVTVQIAIILLLLQSGCTAAERSSPSEPVPAFVGDLDQVELTHYSLASDLEALVSRKHGQFDYSKTEWLQIDQTSIVAGSASRFESEELCAIAIDEIAESVAVACMLVADAGSSPVRLRTESVWMAVNIQPPLSLATLGEQYQMVHHGTVVFAIQSEGSQLKLFDLQGNEA